MSPAPYAEDSERIVLGAMMVDASVIPEVVDIVESSSFYLPRHGVLFAQLVVAWAAEESLDPVAMTYRLEGQRLLQAVGGAEYLHDLVAAVPVARMASHHAGIVAEMAARRLLLEQAARLTQLAAEADAGRRGELVAQVREQLVGRRPGDRDVAPLVQRMSTVEPERIDWLWPGYIARGKLHVVDGDPGLGKSSMTLDLAARLSAGKPWPDTTPAGTSGAVLLVSAEDGLADTIRPRLDAAGADVDQVLALTAIRTPGGERMPALPTDVERLGDLIGEHKVGLVIIDPLMAYLGADVNSHRDQDVRRALAPLSRIAEQHRAAIVLVRHLNKGAGSALYRGGGSIGIVGAARFGYTVGRDPQQEHLRVLASTKANIAIQPPALAFELVDAGDCARIEWHGAVAHSADDLLRGADDESDDREDAVAWLRSYLADNGGEAEATDVLKAGDKVGFSKDSLKRAKKRAHVESRKSAMDAGWMWVIDLEGSTKGAKSAGPND